MDPHRIFSIVNLAALAAWIVLLFAPLARDRIVLAARVMAVALAASYLVFLGISLSGGSPPDFGSLDGVMALLGRPEGALIGWIHYLAFDLWIGSWEVEEAGRRKLPHLLLIPCLALTFMFGPVGLLAFLALRAVMGRRAEPA